MIRVGVIGAGKMGLSHLAILGAHPDVEVVGVCDSMGYLLDVLEKYTGLRKFSDSADLFDQHPDAVLIATPSASHVVLVRDALDRGIHVFCEKPLTLTAAESAMLADAATDARLVTQVGYHNRFVGTFREVKRLLDLHAIGRVSHVLAEAYGPVVLRPKGETWRSRKTAGGGALYDYAAHPLDLLCWYLGEPETVTGTVLGRDFSAEADDEVYGTLRYADDASAQLSVNWSDESYRKMSTKMTLWGERGKIIADRQECEIYFRDTAEVPDGYRVGWNSINTTTLTPSVWYYLRGEEYSAQIDHFVRSVAAAKTGSPALEPVNDFASAAATDRLIERFARGPSTDEPRHVAAPAARPDRRLFTRARRRTR
ncbi:Gfo/Idh/MocA family protein [Agromyces sp. Marseille-P2726]|uniref:Gfo/Idh/MocA family protein n=1 Tax=Agromyces sp. Marseille-P2726 TaxID=2709132 RepID=UPI00156F1B86|nr:Gfo/Idh/MocA family oxidoreductase [Agromyces sp. Marseille-P2726]